MIKTNLVCNINIFVRNCKINPFCELYKKMFGIPLRRRIKFLVGENLKSHFLSKMSVQLPILKSEKLQAKIGFNSSFCYSALDTLLYKHVPPFFLETSILENMGN